MSSPASDPANSVDIDSLRVLSAPHRRVADDRRALERQLDAWCLANSSSRAGLFVVEGDRQHLVATIGAHCEDDFTTSDGWQRIELPGAALWYEDDSDPADASTKTVDGPLLLLASGALITQLKRQVQEFSFQAKFRGVEMEALYEVGLAIASTLDLERLGEEVLMRAVLLLDARRGALYLIEDGRYRLFSRFGGDAIDSFDTQEIDVDSLVAGEDSQTPPEALMAGARHVMAVPIELEHHPRGLLLVADKESRTGVGPFPRKDRRTLSLFANQAVIALENAKLHRMALEKERLEREMELAAEIQQQLLPKSQPIIDGFEVVGWNRPARQVGGDYFGFQHLGDNRWSLVVGDVTGKGVPAALLVSTLHSALRVLLERMEIGPALIERLNQHVFESSSSNKFITLLLTFLDADTGDLVYLNAGHNPGVLLRQGSDEVVELTSKGMPLGLMAEGTCAAGKLALEPGDLLCIYSDGITECEALDDEQYGLERLVELLQRERDQPLADIMSMIDERMIEFAAGRPQGDDQTVILLRRSASEAA